MDRAVSRKGGKAAEHIVADTSAQIVSVHEIRASIWIPEIRENCERVPDFERSGRLDVIQLEEDFASTSEYLFSRYVEREGKWDGNRHLPSCHAGEGDRLDERSLDPRTGRHASLVDRCHGGGIVQCNQVDSRSLRTCRQTQVDYFKDKESMFLQRECMHYIFHHACGQRTRVGI